MKHILHVINGMGSGGAEKVIVDWYRHIDRSRYQFDFLIRSNERFYEKEVNQLGGKIYQVAPFPRKILKNFRETKEFLYKNRYDIIHVHGNALIYIYPLYIAKKLNINTRIIHIHSTKTSGLLGNILHKFNSYIIDRFANVEIACSKEAGEYAYNNKFLIIKNGIELKKYKTLYPKKIYKSKIGISEKEFVIGHIGRFLPVKNHKFLMDIFREINYINNSSKLVLIGDGPIKNEIINYAKRIGIYNQTVFLGERNDIHEIIKAFDVLIFPSLYEGIPLVPLEAQAARIPVLCSDSISDEVCITNFVKKISLKKGAIVWAKAALNQRNILEDCNRDDYDDIDSLFIKNRYDIDSTINEIESIYKR